MLNCGKTFSDSRDKKNKYSNSHVVRKKCSERNKKPHPLPPFTLNGRSLSTVKTKINRPICRFLTDRQIHIHGYDLYRLNNTAVMEGKCSLLSKIKHFSQKIYSHSSILCTLRTSI